MAQSSLSDCTLCATPGTTCCRSREILVTEGDKHCIGRFTGEQNIREYARPNDPDYLDQDDDPNWLAWAFRPDGTRGVLKRRPNGDGRFLGVAGCTLPLEVRPLVCRRYPYTDTERGLNGVADDSLRGGIPLEMTILQMPDMRRANAVRWHGMRYTEPRAKEPSDADRADVRPAS